MTTAGVDGSALGTYGLAGVVKPCATTLESGELGGGAGMELGTLATGAAPDELLTAAGGDELVAAAGGGGGELVAAAGGGELVTVAGAGGGRDGPTTMGAMPSRVC